MKNNILKVITAIAATGWMISVCMLDSETYIPIIINIICLLWLLLIAVANQERFNNF